MSNASNNKPWDSLRQNLRDYPDKPTPMKKIDLIIDALSVAQNSVWSTLNQEALAYAIKLKLELAKPDVTFIDEGKTKKEWVGLSINEGRDFFESKLTRAKLITEINEFLEEKNT